MQPFGNNTHPMAATGLEAATHADLDSSIPARSNSVSTSRASSATTALGGLDDDDDTTSTANGTSTKQNTNPIITLISAEGQWFSIPKQSLLMSELCKTTLEGDSSANELPMNFIESDTIARIVSYLQYHTTVPPRRISKPILSNNIRDLVDRWDSNFIDQPQEIVFKLMLAANYLNIKPLLHLTCAKIGTLLKGKTPDQLRQVLGIRNDFTPAEEEEIRREHRDLIG